MKNILTITLLLPFYLFSQINDGSVILGVQYGFVQDVNFQDLDVNSYSPDMSSDFLSSDKGAEFRVGYKLSKATLGLSYRLCNISGENDIEYHNSNFNERNIFVEYDVVENSNFILFISAGYGLLNYESKRYLVADDTQIPVNSPEGNTTKYNYGLGVKIPLSDNFLLSISTTRDLVEDDGFDGWDYGTNKDKFSFHSLGMSYVF